MKIVVSSASGSNGKGFGALLAFTLEGHALGRFSNDERVVDPRGLRVSADNGLLYLNSGNDRILAIDTAGIVRHDSGRIEGLNPGGGTFGKDGRYYVGMRSDRTILGISRALDSEWNRTLPSGIVPFPRGFAFGEDDQLYLASGASPSGSGEDTILLFGTDRKLLNPKFVSDPELSPLDLTIAPNGNILVSSEFPFAAPDATTTIREYNQISGKLVRVFKPDSTISFRTPRGLRFGPDGYLYCVARDEVVAFDFTNGRFLGKVIAQAGLHGQAIEFFG